MKQSEGHGACFVLSSAWSLHHTVETARSVAGVRMPESFLKMLVDRVETAVRVPAFGAESCADRHKTEGVIGTRNVPVVLTSLFPFVNVAGQIGKFLPNQTKEQAAYKAHRQATTMLYDMDAVANAAGRSGPPSDPISAALAAHGVWVWVWVWVWVCERISAASGAFRLQGLAY